MRLSRPFPIPPYRNSRFTTVASGTGTLVKAVLLNCSLKPPTDKSDTQSCVVGVVVTGYEDGAHQLEVCVYR